MQTTGGPNHGTLTLLLLTLSSLAPVVQKADNTIHQAPVVQKSDSAIHQINLYPVDNAIGFLNTYRYPLDSDLSRG